MSEKGVLEATRQAGLARLAAFLTRAGCRYAESRNYDFGPGNRGNVSLMSPYVRHRLVLEEELLGSALRHHGPAGATKYIQEIFWRTYFKGWLEQRPSVWSDYRIAVPRLFDSLQADAEQRARYESAILSNTGIDCFDAWATELVETGYLHNHARMWFASIWVFTLGLPWQLGADFFYRHLLDGDPASNTLSWRWVCGLHTQGKTYLARASNIARYTDNRFNPQGQLAGSAPALTESLEHPLVQLPEADGGQIGEPFGLLVTEEDCCPEMLTAGSTPQCVLGAAASSARSPLPTSGPATAFTQGAVADALRRASDAFNVPGERGHEDNWTPMLIDWATRNRINTVVTAWAPVGPVAELLEGAREGLARAGIRLRQRRRDYDSVAWPHATRGFFKLRKQIPTILERLSVSAESPSPGMPPADR